MEEELGKDGPRPHPLDSRLRGNDKRGRGDIEGIRGDRGGSGVTLGASGVTTTGDGQAGSLPRTEFVG
jgi:hypothetical protein